MSNEPRKYTKRRRAEAEQATRQRITEAAVELHGSVGPARTTVSAIADRAGVQRATVYRHFPDEEALFAACSSHWATANPRPDPSAWNEIADADDRLRRALRDLYAYYARNEAMLTNVTRDRPFVEAMARPSAAMAAYFETVIETIAAGRPRRRRVRAAIGHAISFAAWQSLVGQHGLDERQAVELMATMVAHA